MISESEKLDAILAALTEAYPGLAEHLNATFEAPVVKAGMDAAEVARQRGLGILRRAQLNGRARGNPTAQFLVRERYRKMGYREEDDLLEPEIQWVKAEEERKQRQREAAAELKTRTAQAYGAPAAKPEDQDLMDAYKARLSKIRKGDVDAIAALHREFRSKGLDI